ncbi:MAG: hypothetical protein WB992_01935 [Bryobacteraceae bacterium]
MRFLLVFLVIAPAIGLAQLPTEVNVTVRPSAGVQYTQPFFDSLHDGTVIAGQLRQAAMDQQVLNETRRHNLAEEQLVRRADTEDRSDYRGMHSREAEWRVNQEVKDAMAACHAAHDDCAKLDGMMLIISKALRPDWTQLSMNEYVESLYVVAKNASFAQQARTMIMTTPANPRSAAATSAATPASQR